MIHRYIHPQAEIEDRPKPRQEEKKHVWKKTNLLATSKLLRELADKKKPNMNSDTTQLGEEESVPQNVSAVKSECLFFKTVLFFVYLIKSLCISVCDQCFLTESELKRYL